MNTAVAEQEADLNQQIDAILEQIQELQNKLRQVDHALEDMADDQAKYSLLGSIREQLQALDELGGLDIFWGEHYSEEQSHQHLDYLKNRVAIFDRQLGEVQKQRENLVKQIDSLSNEVSLLRQDVEILQEEEDLKQDEFVVEREMQVLPFRPAVMPWTKKGEDERRYRKILLACVLYAILFGILIPMYHLPEPDEVEVIEVPERLVKLIEKSKPKPVESKPRQTQQKQAEQKPEKATPEEKKAARKKVERTGLLAFKENFSDLLEDTPDDKLGAKAEISNQGQKTSRTKRSVVTAQAKQGSGGIDTAKISRNVGGSGKSLSDIEFARVESTIGTDLADTQRPLSEGPGPSRTDEEIQIVFDRYKSALYRIYNRELRRNPTLQGKMVLRLTIMPDGSVSFVKVESVDMGANVENLSAKIVARVKRFNFGSKPGVPKVTILYPIDFLPAS